MGPVTLDVPALTPLERIGPKGNIPYVFPFELPENYDLEETVRILRAGYYAASQKFPALICEAVPDSEAQQAGVLKLQLIEDAGHEIITFKDLRAPDAFPYTFAELKEKYFPLSAFETDVVMPRNVWPGAGDRLWVSLAQASFIPGGLLLGWSILHMFGDGTTFHVWMQVWAEECRRAQGLAIPDPVVLPPAIFKDRERLMRPSGRNPGRLEDHPEYTLLPFTPAGAPPKITSRNHRGQVFYLSPEALRSLKAVADPARARQPVPAGTTWISTNDALSALLWRTVMAVQFPLEELHDDPTSTFNIALDGRSRTNPPVHPKTVGCFLQYVAVTLPIRAMLDGTLSIADIAARIRTAVRKAGPDFGDDVAALVREHVGDVDRLVPTAFLDVPGRHCVQSSWVNLSPYGLDWGAALGGAGIAAVRAPDLGVLNGLQVTMPALPGDDPGGLEVLVGVEDRCLDRVLAEPLWNQYAKAR